MDIAKDVFQGDNHVPDDVTFSDYKYISFSINLHSLLWSISMKIEKLAHILEEVKSHRIGGSRKPS